MKNLVKTKAPTVEVPFMGSTVEVRQFSVSDVKQIDKAGRELGKDPDFDAQFGLVKFVIRLGVLEAEKITDKEFETFPMSELTKLSEKVLDISGLGASAVSEAQAGN